MPRTPRKQSSTNTYHVVIRGIDRQEMFEEAKDYFKYLDILALHKCECDFSLYAYCLMSNHVHLIIKTNDVPLEMIFRKVNTQYAMWFNMKYQRVGHLQQGRYYSEPIENQEYLVTAVRYVHQNPFSAGMETAPGKSYRWNSIHDYLPSSNYHNSNVSIVDTTFLNSFISQEYLLEYFMMPVKEKCLDIDSIRKRIPDDVAKSIILEISCCEEITDFKSLPLKKRNDYIFLILKNGVSIRQISRLTGISIGMIQRIIR